MTAGSSSGGRRRAALERSWHDFVEGGPPDVGGVDAIVADHAVRDEVLDSWERSAQALDPTIDHAPIADDAPARWRQSPLAVAFEAVAGDLAQAAIDGDLIAAVTDEDGTIVWTAGGRSMRHRAEQVAFAPGGRWDETSVGTNALGLALREGRPATVWSAEHFAPIVHDWVCYSAPILDPFTGRTRGVLDLSTTWNRATPLAMTTVTALAHLMSYALRDQAGSVPAPRLSGPGTLVLHTLGSARVALNGTALVLAPRQIELLAVLSLVPGGLTLEQLHDRLHGDRPGSPSSTKAELSHLRRAVPDAILNRPYRLTAEVWADHLEVERAVGAGRLADALDLYGGPMLARSSAPAVEEHRRVLEVAVRTAVLAEGHPDRLYRLSAVLTDDAHVQEAALAALGRNDPRAGFVLGRLSLLR